MLELPAITSIGIQANLFRLCYMILKINPDFKYATYNFSLGLFNLIMVTFSSFLQNWAKSYDKHKDKNLPQSHCIVFISQFLVTTRKLWQYNNQFVGTFQSLCIKWPKHVVSIWRAQATSLFEFYTITSFPILVCRFHIQFLLCWCTFRHCLLCQNTSLHCHWLHFVCQLRLFCFCLYLMNSLQVLRDRSLKLRHTRTQIVFWCNRVA